MAVRDHQRRGPSSSPRHSKSKAPFRLRRPSSAGMLAVVLTILIATILPSFWKLRGLTMSGSAGGVVIDAPFAAASFNVTTTTAAKDTVKERQGTNKVVSTNNNTMPTRIEHEEEPPLLSLSQQQNQPQQQQRPLCILHFGPHKTGTTSIQGFLLKHKKQLRMDGYDSTMILGNPNDGRLAILRKCIKLGLECNQPDHPSHTSWKLGLESVVQRAVNSGLHLLVSDEEFAHANFENSNEWHTLRTVLQQHYDVHVILVYRRYFEWLASYYNQHYKVAGPFRKSLYQWPNYDHRVNNATTFTWDDTTANVKGGVPIVSFAEYWDQRLNNTVVKDPFIVNNQWDAQKQRPCHDLVEIRRKLQKQSITVTVLNYHEDGDIVARFACQAIPNATKTCVAATTAKIPRRKNPSRQHDLDRIACEAKKQGILPTGAKRPSVNRQIKDYLQQRNLTLEQLPRKCLEPYQEQMLRDISYQAEVTAMPSAVATFNASFENALSRGKFCSVDVEIVVQDPKWKAFLASVKPGSF